MMTVSIDATTCPLCGGLLRACSVTHTDSEKFPGPRKHCAEASLHNFLVEVTADA